MLSIRMNVLATVLSILATLANADDSTTTLESIGLDGSLSFAIDELRGRLYIETSGRVETWSLYPLRMIGSTEMRNPDFPEVEVVVANLDVSPNGHLYSSGLSWSPKDLRILGGTVIGFEPNADDSLERFSVSEVPPGGANFVVMPQFGDIAFDDSGNAVITSPVDSTVLFVPDNPVRASPGTERSGFELRCGPTAQFTLAELDGRNYYFSSTVDGPLIEIGTLEARLAPGDDEGESEEPECYRITRGVPGGSEEPSTMNAVAHALLEVPHQFIDQQVRELLLALDPNTGSLSLWPIRVQDGVPIISRSIGVELSIADSVPRTSSDPGVYNILAASQDGATIFVGGRSVGQVLRFSLDGNELRFRGQLQLSGRVTSIIVDTKGMIVLVATAGENFDGLHRLHIIKRPDRMQENEQLATFARASIENIQQRLNDAGYEAGPVDGFVGRRTTAAAQAFLEDLNNGGYDSSGSGAVNQGLDNELRRLILGALPGVGSP